MRAVKIRSFRPTDLDELYDICLRTAAGGDDASALYCDPRLVGSVFAAPYAALDPESVFVVEDSQGVGGYIVGARDTAGFAARLEAEWWPRLRAVYPDPSTLPRALWSPDQRMSYWIHHPFRTPGEIVDTYPSHLHIDLLPRLQGQGVGRRLIGTWLQAMREMGSPGAHLAVGSSNLRAIRFYQNCGFRQLTPSNHPVEPLWFVIELAAGKSSLALR
jgi:ribosomal protein S18 acetylase RimI-like enzyme